ncbi:MAG TPA: DUF4395 domain-containing protein [Leptospiraceae bacterium]|nr:DUF4395 domain-containing protein [Leptospiraceae bacterium]HMW04985.1 DUF4395 domain-containing protein [Leptospiraceae bacterium]HMX33876.1 DUF4395 domain-containing protein [Leptospiraceae bacterium]HMY30794.1 DUF4395 domain-containing protein [Leptospiraceae bacterium]HMZ66375.1 DUF4395 domain-containing protein [Leptospiraceae bacterium]
MIKIGNFPEIVNENAARIVALFVVIISLSAIYFESIFLASLLFYGFTARVLYGPKFEPFARLTLDIIIPFLKIGNKPTPGIPKRFAQFIGFLFSLTALILLLSQNIFEFKITLGILSFFAFLESFFGFCAGCFIFSYLMKWGFVPNDVCERCSNINYHI